MKLKMIAGGPRECEDDGCPTVYRTDRNTFVVQGPALDEAHLYQVKLTNGEGAVEIPASLVQTLLANLDEL